MKYLEYGALEDSGGWPDEGFRPVESTVGELHDMGVEKFCGSAGAFSRLATKYGDRVIRCWYRDEASEKCVTGDIYIACTESEAMEMEQLVGDGSLRLDYTDTTTGFSVFEDE